MTTPETGPAQKAPARPRAPRKLRTAPPPEAAAEKAAGAAVAVLEPAPEAPPKWPPIEPQLLALYPDLARPLPDMDAGFTRRLEQMRADSDKDRAKNGALGAECHAETMGDADRAHARVRDSGRWVRQDACAYAAEAGLPGCPGHQDGLPGTVNPLYLSRPRPESPYGNPYPPGSYEGFDTALTWVPKPSGQHRQPQPPGPAPAVEPRALTLAEVAQGVESGELRLTLGEPEESHETVPSSWRQTIEAELGDDGCADGDTPDPAA